MKKFLAMIMLVNLVACGETRQVSSEWTVITYPSPEGTGAGHLQEICYDGVVYLVNSRGGMTVKLMPRDMLVTPQVVAPSVIVLCK